MQIRINNASQPPYLDQPTFRPLTLGTCVASLRATIRNSSLSLGGDYPRARQRSLLCERPETRLARNERWSVRHLCGVRDGVRDSARHNVRGSARVGASASDRVNYCGDAFRWTPAARRGTGRDFCFTEVPTGLGEISPISRSISLVLLCLAQRRTSSWFSSVRCPAN
jgi:hypothetical protein